MLMEWRFKKIRFKQQKKLNESNLYLYKSITKYIQSSELRGSEKEEILQQVMDMMLQAQIEDKPMSLIIGDDYEEFCKSIIEEYSRYENKVFKVVNYLQKCLVSMIIGSVFMVIVMRIFNSSSSIGLTVDQLILVSVFSFIMNPAMKKSSQENSSLISWRQRFYTMDKGITKSSANGFVFTIFAFGVIRFILLKTIGSKILKYIITLSASIPYIITILLIIGSIEVYKRMYNKR